MKGKLSNGFKFEVDTEVFNDMELIEAIAASEGDDPLRIVEVLERILGTEQKKALYEHIASSNEGRVPAAVLQIELGEIMGNAGKNS